MEQNMEQYQRLRDYLNHTKGKRYPFKGHWLEDEDGYLQNAWLKMLCMVLQAARNISEEQTLFLQRLIAGIEAEYDVETYMRQGQEVTPEALEEFIELLLDGTKGDKDEKRYAFVLDALLLSHLGEADEDAEELLAQVCEALRVTLEEMEGLSVICANILCQNIADCIVDSYKYIAIDILHIERPYWLEYAEISRADRDDAIAVVSDLSQYVDVSFVGDEVTFSRELPRRNTKYTNISGISFKNRKYVRFEGLKIPLFSHLLFQNIAQIEFHNCEFIGAGEMEVKNCCSIWLENCKSVLFSNCSFQYFGYQIIYVLGKSNLRIIDCKFSDCILKMSYLSPSFWQALDLGGIIYGTEDSTKLYLEKSIFTNCGSCHEHSGTISSILSNCQSCITNCRFENCWHTRTTISGRIKGTDCNLFAHILSESNNELIDSAELGPH